MDLRLVGSIIGLSVGTVLGLSMGVAAGGGAVNGAYVFGPIGAIIGFLLGQRRRPVFTKENNADSPEKPTVLEGRKNDLADTAEAAFGSVVLLLCSIWNFEMRFFRKVGLMPYLVEKHWLFIPIGILLLAVFSPIGITFCLTGFAALSKGVRAEDDFLVLKK